MEKCIRAFSSSELFPILFNEVNIYAPGKETWHTGSTSGTVMHIVTWGIMCGERTKSTDAMFGPGVTTRRGVASSPWSVLST